MNAKTWPTTWTVREVLLWTQKRFASRGLPTARLDAELLLAHALARSRVMLYATFDQPLGPEELALFRALILRRLEGQPVAYLTGRREFWSLPLKVGPAVLVPRPETETLVQVALALLSPPRRGGAELTVHYDDGDAVEAAPVPQAAAQPLIADIGTGSGAVALAIKRERPAARLFAVDCSAEALEVAAGNARDLGLEVRFLHGDLLAPLFGHGPFDLIVSNPPYIKTADIAQLQPEVQAEPRLALDGGADGLAALRRLVEGAPEHLAAGGALALEVGAGQAGGVATLMEQRGFAEVAVAEDLARVPRVVSGRWSR